MLPSPRRRRFDRVRSAAFALWFTLSVSLATTSCGTLLGAEDEYVVGAGGGGVGGSAIGGSTSGGAAGKADGGSAGRAGVAASAGASGAAVVGGGAGAAGVSGAAGGGAGIGGEGGAVGVGGGGAAGQVGGGAGFGGALVVGGNGGGAGAAGAVAGAAGASGQAGGSAGEGGQGGQGGESGAAGSSAAGASGAAGLGGAGGAEAGGSGGAGASGGSGASGASGASSGSGGAAAGAGGSSGQSGAAGSGGATGGPCCEQEVAALLASLEAQYSNLANTPAFSFMPPSNSKCYTYGTLAENQNGTIRFGAKSLLASCNDLALQVTGFDTAKNAELPQPASGACAASGQNAAAVNAAASFCSSLKKIACTTAIFQGPDAVTAGACTAEICKQCQVGGVADINKWLDTQRTFYNSNKKLNTALVAPTDTPCYDYQVIYNQANWINLAAVAKNAACLNLAARVESSVVAVKGGICTVPGGAAFTAWIGGDANGVIDDCEISNGSGQVSDIRCEGASVPVPGTTSVASNVCP